jgi:ATP-dependent DNA helicase RecG
MNIDRVKRLLKERENIRLEFKEAAFALPGNLFETICGMLNRDGGDIVLGVNNAGELTGVEESQVPAMISDLVNLSNNPSKLDPPFILFPQSYEIEGKTIIHIQVPASSQVHKTVNTIYDRSNDGDFRVTHVHQIAELHNHKRNHYSEGIIYNALRFEDFKADLFVKVRNLIRSKKIDHPWLALDDHQMLEKAGLWQRDSHSGQEGYTLAAAMLFGKDEVIQRIVPHYKIDALVRIVNLNRYDDREYIQTNLIEAYEQVMAFVAKHLPDKFYTEGDQRVSLRSKIFSEIAANMIVHREYTNAFPCTFIIYNDRVEAVNANNPHGYGPIDPLNFAPFAKNPTIAKFFIQIGRVDELGSGVLNVNRLIKKYADKGKVEFIEGATFKTIVPVNAKGFEGAVEGVNVEIEGVNDKIEGVTEGVNDAANDAINGNDAVNNGKKDTINGNDAANDTTNVNDAVNDAVNNKYKDSVRLRLIEIIHFIDSNNSTKVSDLATQFDLSARTIKYYLKILVTFGLVIYKGSKKFGYYNLSMKLQEKLHDKT